MKLYYYIILFMHVSCDTKARHEFAWYTDMNLFRVVFRFELLVHKSIRHKMKPSFIKMCMTNEFRNVQERFEELSH